MSNTYAQQIANSPLQNVYWFARYLIATDYGAIGCFYDEKLMKVVAEIERLLAQPFENKKDTYEIAKKHLLSEIRTFPKEGCKKAAQAMNLTRILENELASIEEISAFCIAMRHIVSPINSAMKRIPSNDKDYVLKYATEFLQAKGESGAGELIQWWDKVGQRGCLDAERTEVVAGFSALMAALENDMRDKSRLDEYLITTAFVQEFERRLGQKRKSRGGGSLEDVVDFLFTNFKFPSTEKPTHFDHDIEVDKWFKCADGWIIGISCKRTLRERWKQLSQANAGTLSHHKIKEIWHISTFDSDLSEEKVVRLGEQRHIFYLMDNGDAYKKYSNHIGMKDYVRPLSRLIFDIRDNIKRQK